MQRAAGILKMLAAHSLDGCRLSDIARETGLGKTTTHRLLAALTDTGFAYQSTDRRYHLGYELVRLGQAATRYNMAEIARPMLLRLARETGDTVFLSTRAGLEAICLDRQVGSYPIKTLTLEVGDRRPLGVGAGSLALLAFLSDEEIGEILAASPQRTATYPAFGDEALRALVRETRERGYALNEGRIVSAMAGVGAPVLDTRGRPAAALSLAAIKERMTPARVGWIASLLQEEARRLAARLAGTAESHAAKERGVA